MIRKIIKITAAVLALLMIACPLAACSTANKTAVSLGDNKVSVGMYSLMASILKGSLAYGNPSANTAAFWDTVVNKDSGQTNEGLYNGVLLETVKNNLYKLAIFDELGLTLPEATVAEIDEKLAFWVDYDGEGSKNNFNEELSKYGANYDILRDYMIMAAKIEYVVEYLYGGGEKISDGVKQQYLDESYVRFKQILLPYFEYVYETDENGDDIYYTEDGKICYDPDNKDATTVDSDGDGKSNRDKNGDIIWYIDDEKGNPHICYDKENGKRKNLLDDNGKEVTREYNSAEKSEVWNNADKIYKETQTGNFNGFEALMLVYDENYGNTAETDITGESIYLNKDIEYKPLYPDGVVDKLAKTAAGIAVGEIARIETDYGVHIIMRYELEDNAWENKSYSGYFEDETGISDFTALLINSLFYDEVQRTKDRLGEVKVDAAAVADVSIKTVGINYDFY